MESTVFDYAIIGAGAAGLHLAMAMSDDPFFASRKILILDKKPTKSDIPTWCFWEKGSGKWDEVVKKTWSKTAYVTKKKRDDINLGAYTYKMIHGTDFFPFAKKILEEKSRFTRIEAEVKEVVKGTPNKIITGENENYLASHVFDSRIDPELFQKGIKYTYLKQHFEGWVIETEEEVFDPKVFTMMDYRLVYPSTTSFTYILPLSSRSGLVEYTFFSPDLVDGYTYEDYLRKYIEDILKVDNYKIIKKEAGVIPMTDFPFHKFNDKYLTRIGTAGGWVKGSTGYSFKNSERKSEEVIRNLKKDRLPSYGLSKKRFRIYDSLFLDVLFNHNEIGPTLFNDMYAKNDIELIFSFLDEQTNFGQEVRIMNTFDKWLFMKAIWRQLF